MLWESSRLRLIHLQTINIKTPLLGKKGCFYLVFRKETIISSRSEKADREEKREHERKSFNKVVDQPVCVSYARFHF